MAHAAEIATPPPGGEVHASCSTRPHAMRGPDRRDATMMAMAQGPIHPIDAPPAIYHHGYRGALTVHQGSLAEVEHFCHTMHGIV